MSNDSDFELPDAPDQDVVSEDEVVTRFDPLDKFKAVLDRKTSPNTDAEVRRCLEPTITRLSQLRRAEQDILTKEIARIKADMKNAPKGSLACNTTLWKLTLQIFGVSPHEIFSKRHGLTYLKESAPADAEPSYGSVFMAPKPAAALGNLITHPVFLMETTPQLLQTALKFAVICRTDDRRRWTFPKASWECSALTKFRAELMSLPESLEDTNENIDVQSGESVTRRIRYLYTPGPLYSTLFDLLFQISTNIAPGRKSPDDPMSKSDGLQIIYSVTSQDIQTVTAAVNSMEGQFVSVHEAQECFKLARKENPPPASNKMKGYVEDSWRYQIIQHLLMKREGPATQGAPATQERRRRVTRSPTEDEDPFEEDSSPQQQQRQLTRRLADDEEAPASSNQTKRPRSTRRIAVEQQSSSPEATTRLKRQKTTVANDDRDIFVRGIRQSSQRAQRQLIQHTFHEEEDPAEQLLASSPMQFPTDEGGQMDLYEDEESPSLPNEEPVIIGSSPTHNSSGSDSNLPDLMGNFSLENSPNRPLEESEGDDGEEWSGFSDTSTALFHQPRPARPSTRMEIPLFGTNPGPLNQQPRRRGGLYANPHVYALPPNFPPRPEWLSYNMTQELVMGYLASHSRPVEEVEEVEE